MNAQAFETLGKRIAALEFERRSKGRAYRITEAHLREVELAALLALAVEEGYKRGLSEGKGEPHPAGAMTAHGRLVSLPVPAKAPIRAGPNPSDVAAALRRLDGLVLHEPDGGTVAISCPSLGPHGVGSEQP